MNPESGIFKTDSIPEEGIDFSAKLQSIEKQFFEEAWTKTNGNESKAARLLNLSRDTFRYRRKKLGLD